MSARVEGWVMMVRCHFGLRLKTHPLPVLIAPTLSLRVEWGAALHEPGGTHRSGGYRRGGGLVFDNPFHPPCYRGHIRVPAICKAGLEQGIPSQLRATGEPWISRTSIELPWWT